MTTASIHPERNGAASAAPADAVDDYIRSLGRRLRGPWRARHGMLQEVRDGLDDATRAMLEDGHTRASAQAVAAEILAFSRRHGDRAPRRTALEPAAVPLRRDGIPR